MKTPSIFAFVLVLLLGISSMVKAQNTAYPIADPGFAYVDMNNDGMYNPADGDIQVDLQTLVNQYGVFNTQISEGSYVAPHSPASLVIPPSVTENFSVPTTLIAGGNIIINGVINGSNKAPYTPQSLTLQSGWFNYGYSGNSSGGDCKSGGDDSFGGGWGDDHGGCDDTPDSFSFAPSKMWVQCNRNTYLTGKIDLTGSAINFGDHFVATSAGDINITNSVITGVNDPDDLTINAGGNIEVATTTNGANLFAYGTIQINAIKNIQIDGAALANYDQNSPIQIISGGALSANNCFMTAYGDLTLQSITNKVSLSGATLDGNNISCNSKSNMDVSNAHIYATGNFTMQTVSKPAGGSGCGDDDHSGCSRGSDDSGCGWNRESSGNSNLGNDDSNDDHSCHADCYNPYPGGNDDCGSNGKSIIAQTITVTASSMTALSNGSIDLSAANSTTPTSILLNSGPLTIKSFYDQVSMKYASISSPTCITVYARHDLLADNSIMAADQMINLSSKYGQVSAVSSVINPYSNAVATTGITINAGVGGVNCNFANWTIPNFITISTLGDISAVSSQMNSGTLQFTANGGLIDITGATLEGTEMFSPAGVKVKGP